MFRHASRVLEFKRVYRRILKHSSTLDELTRGHIRIKARFIVSKDRGSHELLKLVSMYDKLCNLEKIIREDGDVLRQEAYGLIEELDIKYLWET